MLVIAHPSEPKWERTVPGAGSPRLSAEELDAIEAFVHAGGGLVLLAEEEQDKYGNNVAELAARFGIEVQQRPRVRLRAPPRAARRTGCWPTSADGRAEADLLARVHEACFYRATTLRAAGHRRARARARRGQLLGAGRGAARGGAEHGAGRVVVARRLRPVRRRLPRRARPPRPVAEPRPLGRAAVARQPLPALASERAPRPGLGDAQDGDRRAAPQAGAGRLGRPRRATTQAELDAHVEAMAGAIARLAPHFPHERRLPRRRGRRPARLGGRRLRRARLRRARSTCSAPTCTAATASSTSSCSRCTCRTPRATSASRR